MGAPRALLLDLDGTLLDTAPDMTRALNRLRVAEGLDELPPVSVRPHVSHGSARLIHLGFPGTAAPEFERLRQRFLEIYRAALATETQLFEGFDHVFAYLHTNRMPWGIVTNKPGWLTEPLLHSLGLAARAGCIVSGDTLTERKPHPMPLLHAAEQLGLEAPDCVYVGDAERDILAGRAAGMRTVIAAWGYIPAEEDPVSWGADGTAARPAELVDWLVAASSSKPAGGTAS